MERLLILLLLLAALERQPAFAEQHRATRLGHPATRFAPPIATVEDLRSRFRDARLQTDMVEVLRQWGWKGDVNDLFQAALTAEVADIKIAVGTTMPFMSSRENGRPICLRNVLWAGKEPAPAYAFEFTSKGRRYRCVTPKACSNFFVEDGGKELKPALALECTAPDETLAGRPVEACLSLKNTGTGVEPRATVRLAVPPGALPTRASEGGALSDAEVTWEIAGLKPGASQRVCAVFAARQPGVLEFRASASGTVTPAVQSSCSGAIIGVPAILLEVIDLEDPVEVGQEVVYEIKVTNQGTAPGTNIRLSCVLPPGEEFVSGSGATAVQSSPSVAMDVLPALAPKAVAAWRLVVKARAASDARFKVILSSDQFREPIEEVESTQLY